jgi:3-methylfumaryl-CoA hydratase
MGAEKIDIAHLRTWIGRTTVEIDYATSGPLVGLAALLDHSSPPWQRGILPPLGHWLYFLPRAQQSSLDRDGHPRRGSFLPPVPLPRRMWAGCTVRFHTAVPLDTSIERRSLVTDIVHKRGGSGELVFVTLSHEIYADGALAVSERQDIVYRDAAPALSAIPDVPIPDAAAVPPAVTIGQMRRLVPDATQLFRFSALTFNAHRIHYDHGYAREEGYAGLVVHGPYIATLLMDLALRSHPGRTVGGFTFRGSRPLIGEAPCDLGGVPYDGGMELWCRNAAGVETTTARLTWQ